MAEVNPLPLDPTGSKSLMEAQLSLTDLSPLIDLPAKPLAYEPNLQIKGNPITGAEPVLRNDNPNLGNALFDFATNYQPKENKYAAMQPFSYSGDYDAAKFDRYYSTGKLYEKLGFSPYRDNESLYNNKMTVGDQFVRAAKQWDNLVGAGFMSGIKSWKTLFTDPLAPDLEGARDMERATAIGSSNTGGLSSFFINTFLNSGYTVGIGADFLAGELALTGATVLTGGALGETTIPAMIAKARSAGNNFFNFLKTADKVEDAFKAAKNINRFDGIRAVDDINTARTFWNTVGGGAKKVVGGVADILNPLDNTIAALRAKDYATDYAKISRTFGAFADDLMMMKGAVAEAKMEGGMSKLNVTKELIDEYRSINGKDPEGEELAKIEAIAQDEAKRTAFWNLPAITTSNKLMYATMLAPFRKIMGRETTKLIDDIVFENKTFRAVGEGMFDRAKVAAKSLAKSLAKPKFYGEFGMNYLKTNLAEGVQENIQEAISSGASKHAMALYRDPIRGSYEGYMPYFMKGLGEQFSAQGAETFAGGFAMALFAQPIMGGAGISMSKIMDATLNKKNAEALKEAKRKQLHGYTDEQTGEVVKGDIQVLNELYQDHLKYFSPDLENAVRTGRLANDMYSAARAGNKKEAIDAKDGIQTHHIMTALRTGKFDIFMDKLADYKNLTKEEAVEAFGKYGVEAQDADKAMAQIDGVIARAKEIKANYEEGANQYPNPYEPTKFRKDPKKYIAAVVAKKAWDEAVYNMVFAKSTFQQYSQRVADISNKFSQISGDLASADSQGLMSLLSPKTALQEINNLKKEISVLDASIPEQKKIKTEKTKQLEKLDDFYQAVAEMKYARNEKEKLDAEAKAKKTFSNYVGHLARKNDNIVFDSTIAEAYKMVSDHMLLRDDMAGLARSINVLMAPKSFLEFQKNILNTYDGIFQGRADLLELNSEEFHLIKDINDITNTITKRTGLMLPEDFILEFAEAKKNKTELPFPEYLVDENGDVVMEGPKFIEALQIWQNFVGEEVVETATATTTTAPKKYDSADFSTYPKDLVEFIRATYDNIKFEETSPYYIGITKEGYAALTADEQAPYDKEAADNFEAFATDPSREPLRRKFFELQKTETPKVDTDKVKADLAQGKVGNTHYEVKADGVYFKGNKLDNPKNLSHKELIEGDIERRRREDLGGGIIKGNDLQNIIKKALSKLSTKEGIIPLWQMIGLVDKGGKVMYPGVGNFKGAIDYNEVIKEIYNIYSEHEADKIVERLDKEIEDSGRKYEVDEINAKYDAELAALEDTDAKADIERRRQEELKPYDERDIKSLETIMPNNPNHPSFKVGMKFNQGMKIIVEDTLLADNYDGREDAYEVITAVISPAEFGVDGKMTKAAKVNVTLFNTKEDADKAIQEKYGKVKSKVGQKQKEINAKYDAELAALKGKKPGLKRPTPEAIPVAEVRVEVPDQFQNAENQDLEWQGMIGRIKVYGPDNIVFVTNNVEYQVEKADIFADPAKFGFQGIVKPATIEAAVKPYTVENITEDTVTVNGVDYLINTDTMGNVESLSPTNRPEQQITNNKMMIAVEIERNKLEYRTNQDVVDSAIAEKTALPDATTTVIEGIYVQNFTDTVAEGLDKLYASQPLTAQEQLQVELWAFDALDRVLTLSDKHEYKNNAEVQNAIKNLRQIINELYGTVKAKTETGAKQAPVSKPTEKGKRTIKRESSKKQAEQVKVEGEIITSTKPTVKKAPPVTPQSINADKTLDNLKKAKEKKFEVVYKGIQYKIKRINKNSVILSSPNKPDAKVDLEDLDAIKVVQPGAKKFSPEENKSVVENGEVIATTKRTFTEEPNLQELKKAFLNSLCK